MFDLTKQEISVLMEALDAWIYKDTTTTITDDLMSNVFVPPGLLERAQEEFKKREKEREKERKNRDERATLLKAKLIKYKDSLLAEEAFKEQP